MKNTLLKKFSVSLICSSILLGTTAYAQKPPVAQEKYGDGRVSAFYTWNQNIPNKAGELLRTEKITSPYIRLDNDSQAIRILYSSTSGADSKTPIVVSGSIHVPKGTPPKGGWPVVLWGHGTVGLADSCAPSWNGRSYRDVQYLNRWLKEGFAVVATDYEGLGVPGPHLLINNPMLAYNILDSGRAALKANLPLANKFVIVGQSQGGAGAVAAATYSKTYAPDLNIKGAVGTGVIYKDPNATEEDNSLKLNPHEVSPSLAYGIYSFLVAQSLNPEIKAEDIFTPEALPLVEQGRNACLVGFMSDIQSSGLSPAKAYKADQPTYYKQILEKQSNDYGYYPTLKVDFPIFIGTGANDVTPDARNQMKLVADACKAGTVVEGHLYHGLGHSETVNASLKDSIPFAKKVISDQKIQPICKPDIQ
ncbi:signal peptide-containing protein [Acinetobacter sp. ANC 4558]|uniref:lipase family protein n=1 Tax=Acinetobacter sp. ANC 4558 TaxID=1977876 RepID=UPI000A35300A|nr:lipase family protein [Acinetobacter sp. ANC 4558]OTG84151.1 signal peptide-containing protein [Acinetobacter sp. ANC 4558]